MRCPTSRRSAAGDLRVVSVHRSPNYKPPHLSFCTDKIKWTQIQSTISLNLVILSSITQQVLVNVSCEYLEINVKFSRISIFNIKDYDRCCNLMMSFWNTTESLYTIIYDCYTFKRMIFNEPLNFLFIIIKCY